MSTRDRRGAQLSVELPPELLARLRGHAAARGATVAALMRRWIEAGLAGELEGGAAAPGSADLVGRVAALEAAMAAMAPPRPASPKRVSAPSPDRVSPLPQSDPGTGEQPIPQTGEPVEPLRVPLGAGTLEILGAGHLHPPAAEGAITTAELAQRTGTNRHGWNNWAGKAAVGDVRSHHGAGSWRLVGKAPAPGGGPARWLWQPA